MKQAKKNKRLKKGDTVIAIAGNDKGQKGTILEITGKRAVVQGLNLRKKHMRKTQTAPQGSIVDIECSIDLSNLMLCVDDKPVKLKSRQTKKGEKELYFKDGKKAVAYRQVKKS